jgi:hypothetical protein
MWYSKQAPFMPPVFGMSMVKLVAATLAARMGAVLKVNVVLQVLESTVPSAAFAVMNISLFAVTAVVLTMQVWVEATASQ